MLAVVLISLWPSHSWICFMGTLLASSREAQLCRRSRKRMRHRPFLLDKYPRGVYNPGRIKG